VDLGATHHSHSRANVWLPTSLITLAQDSALEYVPATARARGEFHISTDFGKHAGLSVVAVIDNVRLARKLI